MSTTDTATTAHTVTSTDTMGRTTTSHGTGMPQAPALPSGATVEEVNWKQYVNYAYEAPTGTSITARVLEACGTDARYNYGITSASCSGAISANLLSGSNSNVNERKLISSLATLQLPEPIPEPVGKQQKFVTTTLKELLVPRPQTSQLHPQCSIELRYCRNGC